MTFDVNPSMTTSPPYSPTRALTELKAQHDALRAIMDRCEQLADALEAGGIDPTPLTREVTRLRLAFEAHNKFEEQLLKPVLLASDAHAGVRIERMVEDHVGEHREMRARLGTTELSELRDAIETLRAHLEAEERYLLTSRVLRDEPPAPSLDEVR
jgi:hypothetical protein